MNNFRMHYRSFRYNEFGNATMQAAMLLAIAALALQIMRGIGGRMAGSATGNIASLFTAQSGNSGPLDDDLVWIDPNPLPPSGEPTSASVPGEGDNSSGSPGGESSSGGNSESARPNNPNAGKEHGDAVADDDFGDTAMDDLLQQPGPLAGQSLESATRTAMLLSQDAYKTDLTDRTGPPDWSVVNRITRSQGFAATVYRKNVDGKEVIGIAFRGTEDAIDWVTNLANFAFGSEQYLDAIKMTRAVQSTYPNAEIFLTGHSLGGGLANASAMTQVPALAINAVGPSYPHLLSIGSANLVRRLRGGETFSNVVHVNTRRDPLTNSDAGHPWGNEVFVIQHPDAPSFDDFIEAPEVLIEAHSVDYAIEALDSGQPIRRQ